MKKSKICFLVSALIILLAMGWYGLYLWLGPWIASWIIGILALLTVIVSWVIVQLEGVIDEEITSDGNL